MVEHLFIAALEEKWHLSCEEGNTCYSRDLLTGKSSGPILWKGREISGIEGSRSVEKMDRRPPGGHSEEHAPLSRPVSFCACCPAAAIQPSWFLTDALSISALLNPQCLPPPPTHAHKQG